MNNLSTFEEIEKRGTILEITPSIIRENTWIIIFKSGDQANINEETYNKLEQIKNV